MFSNNTIVLNEQKSLDDKNRYAYEKAIEAYWHHVNRYHTWMNYYAIFNGTLFVGFCTLLTATTTVEIGCKIDLSNNYNFICILISVIGTLTSICWYNSILGHEKWEINWMNIIEYYEIKVFPSLNEGRIYNMLILDKESVPNKDKLNDGDVLDENVKIDKGYSTHALTKSFVFMITLAWIMLIFHKCLIDVKDNDFFASVLTIIIVGVIIIIYMGFINFYSVIQGKVWKQKDIEKWNKNTH